MPCEPPVHEMAHATGSVGFETGQKLREKRKEATPETELVWKVLQTGSPWLTNRPSLDVHAHHEICPIIDTENGVDLTLGLHVASQSPHVVRNTAIR